MVQRCLDHISKLILLGKSLANYLNTLYSTLYMYMNVFYACILSMYSMHVFYSGHLVDPQGPFGRMFRKLRIQGRMQIFEKMSQKGLNHDLRLEVETRGKMLQIPLKNVDLGAFCVEL